MCGHLAQRRPRRRGPVLRDGLAHCTEQHGNGPGTHNDQLDAPVTASGRGFSSRPLLARSDAGSAKEGRVQGELS